MDTKRRGLTQSVECCEPSENGEPSSSAWTVSILRSIVSELFRIPGKIKRLLCRCLVGAGSWLSLDQRDFLLRWVSKRPWLVALYYFATGDFTREQVATFSGRFSHVFATEKCVGDEIRYGLRRSIHRIEKGLIMRPRREVFADDYIEDAVRQFIHCSGHAAGNESADDPLVKWANDVLHQFFAVTGSSPRLDAARATFMNAVDQDKCKPGKTAPYRRDTSPLRITIEDMLELAKRRRSVRWYLPNPVPRKFIDNAINVARLSPSACNRQPFEFRVFDATELVREVGALPMGATGFVENVPCIVVLIGQLRAFPFERDRHLIYIDAALAAMAFEFALEVQGIASCSINWPDIPKREAKISTLLNLKADERPVMLISLGYPDPTGLVPYSEKKSLEEIRTYNIVDKSPDCARVGSLELPTKN